MSEGPEWFAPRRYGYGAGPPISWQGWAVTLAFATLAVGAGLRFHDRPYQAVAALIPLIAVFMVIAAKTTRGGWRWRWGDDD
ncbi:hypothetical protein [Sphingomonas sp. URHD0057]|uniref:hypothetical protein n=1 Tax=Sphingomonas sp. URHD0057 TaxID=1380389 RepID=UPI00048F4792|nr:hypothetical protein [Sphingomonas sp. URHD0057]